MKLPRLPHKCSVLDAKYSTQQMREYAHKAIREYLNESYKQPMTLVQVAQQPRSIIERVKDVLL